jgi:hypothetical protein
MDFSTLKNSLVRFKVPLILFATILVLLLAFLASPFSPTHLCTLMSCLDSLELTLVAEPPHEYTVKVIATNSGQTRRVTCVPGESRASYPDVTSEAAICDQGKVTFLDFAPEEVSIQVIWQEGNYNFTGQATYDSFRPNGRFCPPECRRGKLSVDLYQG